MLDWYARALHLPKQFIFEDSDGVGGGSTQNSASDSIHNSIMAARFARLKEAGCYENPPRNKVGKVLIKLVSYTSMETHSCCPKAAQIAMCTMRLLVPDNDEDYITGPVFEKAVTLDVSRDFIPFYMCASVGTTGGCAFDDVEAIGKVCKKYNIYLHVDGAYAGNAFIVDKYAYLRKGLEYADSIDVNPYKCLLAAADMSCLWVKNTRAYTETYAVSATYLLEEFQGDKNSIDYRNYGISLSRRMRALKFYFLFRMFGIEGLQTAITGICDAAEYFEKLVKADPRFEVVNKRHLGLVCFRQKPQNGKTETETDEQNINLHKRLNENRVIHLVPGHLRKMYMLRMSVNYRNATDKTMGNYINFSLKNLNLLYKICNCKIMLDEAWKEIQSHYVTKLDESPIETLRATPPAKLQEFAFISDHTFIPAAQYTKYKESSDRLLFILHIRKNKTY